MPTAQGKPNGARTVSSCETTIRAGSTRWLANVGLLSLLFGIFFSPIASAWQTPQQAVDEFLKFELAGGRMASWTFAKYLAVSANYEEPGWDEIELVRDAKVLSLTCEKPRCEAAVSFTFTPTERLNLNQVTPHPKGGSETMIFVVVQRDGQWLLESSNGKPRVSYATFKRLYPNGL